MFLGIKRNIEHLARAKECGKLSHAYLISGEKGSGKKTFADYVTAALLCEKNHISEGPCGNCPACAKTFSNNHPDVVRIAPPAPGKQIPVSEVRQQLVDDMAIKPFYGSYKIYIVEEAQLLNESSQNAILKTIEEPPEYGIIFLLTENPDALLETIRSRCIRLDMERLSDDVIKNELKKRYGAAEAAAAQAAAFAGGNLGRAAALFEEDGMADNLKDILKMLKNISSKTAADINRFSSELEKSMDRGFVMMVIRMWLRDLLVAKADGDAELYFPGERKVLKTAAGGLTYEQINNQIKALDICSERLRANVKADAAYETMLLGIRENSMQARPVYK